MAMARWIADARVGRPLLVYGALSRARDVTDVRDVVRAILVLLERGTCTTVNVGTGVARSLGDLAAAVRHVVAPVPVEVVPLPAREPDETRADTVRALATFGFVPSTDPIDVARRMARVADEVPLGASPPEPRHGGRRGTRGATR